uniref:DUF19 domain-containing protein n=1 Tax=Trichobilharzia regenti TaxID=157069 RepID=A0AA85JAC2_TRIRE|nr:unnamed protein product [Trichobilharzia regenti]
MNASLKSVFICFSVTVLLCLFNECKSTETQTLCEPFKRFEICANKARSDILNPTADPEFDLSSMQHAANMNIADFQRECIKNKVCMVKTHLCYLSEQLQPEYNHCYNKEELQALWTAHGYLISVRHTPTEFDMEKFITSA